MGTGRPSGPRTLSERVRVRGQPPDGSARILTPDALEFVGLLHREFEPRRRGLLRVREGRERRLASGRLPAFPRETRGLRAGSWTVAPPPPDLRRRWVEITGPADRKMMINALNSGADVFMADLEDSLSPTWDNVVEGQANLFDAAREGLFFRSPDGREYRVGSDPATLLVRPRGWHLEEGHVRVDGAPVSASLFDFALHAFHNARALLDRGSGPYFYLAKLEGRQEARLWNDVFLRAQELLGLPRGTIRATVLVENVLAAFEMDEILWELREHIAGLNAGRWDYIFSVIKKFRHRPEYVLPDRGRITMTVPFMRAYTELLVRTCHRRGAHAIGGMAAYIPDRRDAEANERALAGVRADKVRESRDGFDGTWVAHPDLVPVARDAFAEVLGDAPHQKDRSRDDVEIGGSDLLDLRVPGGRITRDGLVNDVAVALRYLTAWLSGRGAVAIFGLMEDTATAEIARAQLWQWVRHGARLEDGARVTGALYRRVREVEASRVAGEAGEAAGVSEAAALLDELVLSETFVPFLTLPGYERLVAGPRYERSA